MWNGWNRTKIKLLSENDKFVIIENKFAIFRITFSIVCYNFEPVVKDSILIDTSMYSYFKFKQIKKQ